MGREVEIAGQVIEVDEHNSLEDEVGATVWDCALVLAHYLEHSRAQDLQGKRAIELGSGTGLVGLAAAILGSVVTLTDRKHLLDGRATTCGVAPDMLSRFLALVSLNTIDFNWMLLVCCAFVRSSDHFAVVFAAQQARRRGHRCRA
eukprot:1195430-Prorocentrum_minimum.AAC.10